MSAFFSNYSCRPPFKCVALRHPWRRRIRCRVFSVRVATNEHMKGYYDENMKQKTLHFYPSIMTNCLTIYKEPHGTPKRSSKGHLKAQKETPGRIRMPPVANYQDRMSMMTSSENRITAIWRISRFRFRVTVFSETLKYSAMFSLVSFSK